MLKQIMSNFWKLVILSLVGVLGCANPDGMSGSDAMWGGQCSSVRMDEYSYQYYWQVYGVSTIPVFFLKRNISDDDWNWDWQVAVVLVARCDDVSTDSVPFPFESSSFSSCNFSIEDSMYSFSENEGTVGVVFYSDAKGNVKKLIVDKSQHSFDFFTKQPLGKASHSDVIKFWHELQKYDIDSTFFWEKQ